MLRLLLKYQYSNPYQNHIKITIKFLLKSLLRTLFKSLLKHNFYFEFALTLHWMCVYGIDLASALLLPLCSRIQPPSIKINVKYIIHKLLRYALCIMYLLYRVLCILLYRVLCFLLYRVLCILLYRVLCTLLYRVLCILLYHYVFYCTA